MILFEKNLNNFNLPFLLSFYNEIFFKQKNQKFFYYLINNIKNKKIILSLLIFILFFYNQSTILNIGKGKCLYFLLVKNWKINFLKISFINFNNIIINKKKIIKYKNRFITFSLVYKL